MFTAPDEHMPYIIQLHIMSIQPANRERERNSNETWLSTKFSSDHDVCDERQMEVVRVGGGGGGLGGGGGGRPARIETQSWSNYLDKTVYS